jgi:hypothetical protein
MLGIMILYGRIFVTVKNFHVSHAIRRLSTRIANMSTMGL